MTTSTSTVLVLGATGYVGSRLVPLLLAAGHKVRAAGRSLEKLQSRTWSHEKNVELIELDILDEQNAEIALSGCSHVYYLVHSMNPQQQDFEESDKKAARNIVNAGEKAGIRQLIYLGGLGESNDHLSKHLRSRAEVADILHGASFATTVLRAAMIIGSGSASFEILRYLVDRLPVMVTPRWVSTPSQPIAIRNVLEYLIGCLDNKATFDQTFDIGGPEIITYQRLMEVYAEEAALTARFVVPVPVFTPRLSSYWINFITPVPAYIARPLAEGLKNPVICMDDRIKTLIPQELLDCRQAIRLAIDKMQHQMVESHWTDAGRVPPVEWMNSSDPSWAGGTVYTDVRRVVIEGDRCDAWRALSRIGGTTGWYYANWLWQLRGLLDWLIGGIGLRKGRRHPSELRVGDAIDFWRVKVFKPNEMLVLVAEMRLPGQAVLEFRVRQLSAEQTEIVQIARFLPSGLLGIAYWWAVSPLHEFVFSGMLEGIAAASSRRLTSRARKLSAVPASA